MARPPAGARPSRPGSAVRAASRHRGPHRIGLWARPAPRHLVRDPGPQSRRDRSIHRRSWRRRGRRLCGALYRGGRPFAAGRRDHDRDRRLPVRPVDRHHRGARRRAGRRHRDLPDRAERVRRMPDAARRAVRGEARGGLPRRCVQLSVVPAARAVSVLAGQSGARAVRRPALDLRRRHRHRHPAGDIGLRGVRRGSRQRHRGAGEPIQCLPRRRPRRLQDRFRSVACADADAAAGAWGVRAAGARSGVARAASSGASSTPASRRRLL